MAKQRAGYVYQESVWYVNLEYGGRNGSRQKITRKANSEVKAKRISEQITAKLRKELGESLKVSQRITAKKENWVCRVTLADETGKRRNVKRYFPTKTEAKEELKRLLRKLDTQGELSIDGDRLTFRELAALYKERRLIPAEYHDERKIAGLRSYKTPQAQIEKLAKHFGSKRIRNLTHSDVEQYKQIRLKAPIVIQAKKDAPDVKTKQRTIASVNRELELLRAVLRFAVRQGWLLRSPFEMGSPIISKADETRRERVLSHDEEIRLLSVCTDRRAHLKPLLIAALDTAARRGELFKLTWGDVDFQNRLISLRATTTKTQRSRTIGMTERLYDELQKLYECSTKKPDDLVFGFMSTVKKSFASACSKAGIKDFRFHDCRHTAITRMVQSGMASHLIMKVSGHTQPITFSRYVNVDDQTARQAAMALEKFNESAIAGNTMGLVN